MVVISAHKFGGPVGIGALLLRDWAMLAPAGGQERGYRPGTENLPGVMAMLAALEAEVKRSFLREQVVVTFAVCAHHMVELTDPRRCPQCAAEGTGHQPLGRIPHTATRACTLEM